MTHNPGSRSPVRHDASSDQASRWAPRLTLGVTLGYTWVLMTLFGAIVLETVMVYPNVFRDPPQSLELTVQFLAVVGPSGFFPPLGFLSWALGGAALLLCWRQGAARWWVLLSLAMLLAEGVASMLYFWPRNEIMFVEGLSVHDPGYLIQVAEEFQTWHWRSRMGFNTVAAIAAFAGFLGVYRTWVTAAKRDLDGSGCTHGPARTCR